MTDFHEGDAIWINDGYTGSPHAAVVSTVTPECLYAYALSTVSPNDSRTEHWQIANWKVSQMVTHR
jgi:hypothetical protein